MGKGKALPFVAAVAVLACLTGVSPASASARTVAADPVIRVYGSDRIATAVAVSASYWHAAGSALSVTLARSDAFPDGLAGAPLAWAKRGPLLLTTPTGLDPRVTAEIKRVLPLGSTVYELGGTASISSGVDATVRALGYPTVRLGGADRFATSVAIANAFPAPTKALVVTGLDFPDALGAGAAAGFWGSPVLLSDGPTLPASVKAYLDAHPSLQVWGVGGQGAAAAKAYLTPDRSIVGVDRYDTATKLAAAFFTTGIPVVVNGLNYPDGLSGGAFAAALGGPLVLTPAQSLNASTAGYLRQHASGISKAYVLGGPAMVSDSTLAQVAAAIT